MSTSIAAAPKKYYKSCFVATASNSHSNNSVGSISACCTISKIENKVTETTVGLVWLLVAYTLAQYGS